MTDANEDLGLMMDYRHEIKRIDNTIIELLVRRFDLTDSIGKLKKKNGIPIENKEIEAELLTRINHSRGNLDRRFIWKLYSSIIKESKDRQTKI